ncbi:MAG TPA: response regulator [Pyrinomonadaceae bacterium]|nr:response regulator [Pyrinomonadaceae bacterium]
MPSLLIVEDFDLIRNLLFDIFAGDYECATAASAEEGLALLTARRFDVVITDVKLPGMNGGELLRAARARWPGLPVIIITGGFEGRQAEDFLRDGAFGYVLKPFTTEEIEELTARAVEVAGA